MGAFPTLSRLVWYNCLGSKYDLTKRAAASAAASYLECDVLLALSLKGLALSLEGLPLASEGCRFSVRCAVARQGTLSQPTMPMRGQLFHIMSTSKSFRCNTYDHLVCIADKGFAQSLSLLDAPLTKNGGCLHPHLISRQRTSEGRH